MPGAFGGIARQVVFAFLFLAVLLLAFILRFDDLGLKPLHGDESINAWLGLDLHWNGRWSTVPVQGDGSLVARLSSTLFGLFGPSDGVLRGGPALAGALVPVFLLPLGRYLGGLGLLVAAALLSISPIQVYFARTAVGEAYVAASLLVGLYALCNYVNRPALRPVVLFAVAVPISMLSRGAALLFWFALLFGLLLAWQLGRQRPSHRGCLEPDLFGGRGRRQARFAVTEGGLRRFALGLALACGLLAIGLAPLPGGLESLSELLAWGLGPREDWFFGSTDGAVGLTALFLALEAAWGWTLVPVGLSLLLAFSLRHRFALLLGGWGLGSFLLVALAPWKGPGALMQIEVPLALLLGWGTQQALVAALDLGLHPGKRAIAVVLAVLPVATAGPLVGEAWFVNQWAYDDRSLPYVDKQTLRGIHGLTRDLLGLGDSLPQAEGRGARMVTVDAKHPIAWYVTTRGWDPSRSRHLEQEPEIAWLQEADVVLASGGRTRSVEEGIRRAGGSWHQEVYPLRPGWRVTAWYRQDLWEAYQDRGGQLVSPWPRPATLR